MGPAKRRRAVEVAVVEGLFGEVAGVGRERPVVLEQFVQVARAVEVGVAAPVAVVQHIADAGGGEGPHRRRNRPDLLAVLMTGPPAVALVAGQSRDLALGGVPKECIERRAHMIGQTCEVLVRERRPLDAVVLL